METPGCCVRRTPWKPGRRWLVLIGGFIVHFSLGTLYTHGNLAPYIVSYIQNRSHPHNLSSESTTWLYGLSIIGQGSSMFAGGYMELKLGPRLSTIIGSVIMCAGVLISAGAIKVSFYFLLFTYGFLFGVGSGIAFIAPLVCAMRWLPKWKGVASGSVVAGFGLGGLIFDLLQTQYINPHNLKPLMTGSGELLFTDEELLSKVPLSFIIFGFVYLAMLLLGSALLVNPPPCPTQERRGSAASVEPPASILAETDSLSSLPSDVMARTKLGNQRQSQDGMEMRKLELSTEESAHWTSNIINSIPPMRMLKTINFYHLWVIFFLNSVGITATITTYKLFGQTVIYDDRFLAAVGSVAAIFNCFGRVFWGFLADKFSFKVALVCLTACITVLTLTFYASVLGTHPVYFIWVCALFFCIGGNSALFLVAVARSYGPKFVGLNYGILFVAQIIVGVVASLIANFFSKSLNWHGYFFIASAFSAFAFLISLCFRPKRFLVLF